jgi:hypothetical protein
MLPLTKAHVRGAHLTSIFSLMHGLTEAAKATFTCEATQQLHLPRPQLTLLPSSYYMALDDDDWDTASAGNCLLVRKEVEGASVEVSEMLDSTRLLLCFAYLHYLTS